MIVVALLLLALTAATPLALSPLRRILVDPVVTVAAAAAGLLALTAVVAATADPAQGWTRGAITVLGVVVATTCGSTVVRAVFRLVWKEFMPVRTSRPATEPADDPPVFGDATEDAGRPENVLRGGAWIGYLERASISATLLAGWPEGAALVLAVKGVGRYPELRENNAPEAFIIGTLASLLWAAAAAGTAHLLLR